MEGIVFEKEFKDLISWGHFELNSKYWSLLSSRILKRGKQTNADKVDFQLAG